MCRPQLRDRACEMNDAVRFLCQNATMPISVLPNAGLPQNVGGRAVYKLTPADLRASSPVRYRVWRSGGGRLLRHHACAIKAAAEAVAGLTPLGGITGRSL